MRRDTARNGRKPGTCRSRGNVLVGQWFDSLANELAFGANEFLQGRAARLMNLSMGGWERLALQGSHCPLTLILSPERGEETRSVRDGRSFGAWARAGIFLSPSQPS